MDRPPPETDIKLDNMSRQDLKKIEKSMKRPQFLGLLNEYMIEISDPKNKNEYDEYLRQMEREKELPKHMKIVELKPKFCFRTFIVSQKNKKHEMKFFVNMCETEYLEKPACEPGPGEDGKVGYSWKIPNSSGKIRYDQDKKGSPCQVIDVAFHPDTFLFAARKQFQEMMINIALQAAEKQLGERKESLSRDYVILKNVICKGQDGKPALMPIRYIEGKVYNKGEGPSTEPERDNEGRETKLQKEINKQKEEHDKNKKQKDQKPKDEPQIEEQEVEDKKLVVDLSEGVQRPKYSTIFTYPVDYSEFMQNPAMNTRRKVPSAFNIQFFIPRVDSISEIADQKLEINDKKIILKIGQKYFIDLQLQQFKLKYVIQTASAKAKYDKKKKCLRIIIPIDQSINYHPQEVQEAPNIKESEETKPDIVESEVWKNKMLDFTEPSVSVKMLNNEKTEEEKPKLVEEIDQEDQIAEANPKVEKVQEEQDGEYTVKKQQKFSVSNYYKKNEHEANNKIKYIFQETADKIVLVLQMKNYKKEEISTLVSGNCDLLLEWKQAGKEVQFYHLRVKEEFVTKVLKIEVKQMINFVAFTLTKSEKGKYWQKSSIEEVNYVSQGEKGRYQSFRQAFNLFEQAQREVQIVEKAGIQTKAATKAIQQRKIPEQRKLEADPQEPLQDQPKALPLAMAEPQKSRTNIFNNLQVQFITFNAPFIELLD